MTQKKGCRLPGVTVFTDMKNIQATGVKKLRYISTICLKIKVIYDTYWHAAIIIKYLLGTTKCCRHGTKYRITVSPGPN